MHYTFWIPLFLWGKEGKHPAPQKLLRSILIRYLMMITSNCWSANKVHEHGQIVRFCHSVADLAWKHHWNTRKLWNNMFSVFFFLVFASKCAIDACFAINLVQKDDLVFLGAKEASGRKLPLESLKSLNSLESLENGPIPLESLNSLESRISRKSTFLKRPLFQKTPFSEPENPGQTLGKLLPKSRDYSNSWILGIGKARSFSDRGVPLRLGSLQYKLKFWVQNFAFWAQDVHPPHCSLKPQERKHKMDSHSSRTCPLFLRPKSKPCWVRKKIA